MAENPRQSKSSDQADSVEAGVNIDVGGSLAGIHECVREMEGHLKSVADWMPTVSKALETQAAAIRASVDQQKELLAVLTQAMGLPAGKQVQRSSGLDEMDRALDVAEAAATPADRARAMRDVIRAARSVRATRADRSRVIEHLRRQVELAHTIRPAALAAIRP